MTTATDSRELPPVFGSARLGEHLDISPETLAKWRQNGEGPPSIRLGKHVRYRREDVEAWLEAKKDEAGEMSALMMQRRGRR